MKIAVLFCFLIILAVVSALPIQQREIESSIKEVTVERVDIIDAVRALKNAVNSKVVFTLEVAAFENKPEKNLSLHLKDGTLKEALTEISREDKRYTWIAKDGVIHIFPREARQDDSNLLNTPVRNLHVTEKYDILMQSPRSYIPELQMAILHRTGEKGYVGSLMSGVNSSKVTVNLENGTVRDVLNQVASRLLEIPNQPPIGWVYTFRIDKSLKAGGEPLWRLL